MSNASVKSFVQALESNEILLQKLKIADSLAAVVEIAAEYGYELTEEEIQAVFAEYYQTWEDDELSEELLESIAGGGESLESSEGGFSGDELEVNANGKKKKGKKGDDNGGNSGNGSGNKSCVVYECQQSCCNND